MKKILIEDLYEIETDWELIKGYKIKLADHLNNDNTINWGAIKSENNGEFDHFMSIINSCGKEKSIYDEKVIEAYLIEKPIFFIFSIRYWGNLKTKDPQIILQELSIMNQIFPPFPRIPYLTYLMRDSLTGYYKIGKSKRPEYRLNQFLCANMNISIDHIIKRDVESELHNIFSEKIVHREWFNLSKEDVLMIKRLS